MVARMSNVSVVEFSGAALLRAASWIASRPYGTMPPVLQVSRHGDLIEIAGSNGYTLILGHIRPSRIDGLDDGQGYRMGDARIAHRVSRVLRDCPQWHEIEIHVYQEFAVLRMGTDVGDEYEYLELSLSHVETALDMSSIVRDARDEGSAGAVTMWPIRLREVQRLMRTVGGPTWPWAIETHGPKAPIVWSVSDDTMKAQAAPYRGLVIASMPCRQD
jgi:hypothetical protein